MKYIIEAKTFELAIENRMKEKNGKDRGCLDFGGHVIMVLMQLVYKFSLQLFTTMTWLCRPFAPTQRNRHNYKIAFRLLINITM